VESLPGQRLVAVLPVEQDLTLLGQVDVTWQAELQLYRSDQIGVATTDGSLEELLGVLVVDHLRHTGRCLTANTHQTALWFALQRQRITGEQSLALSNIMTTMKGCQGVKV